MKRPSRGLAHTPTKRLPVDLRGWRDCETGYCGHTSTEAPPRNVPLGSAPENRMEERPVGYYPAGGSPL